MGRSIWSSWVFLHACTKFFATFCQVFYRAVIRGTNVTHPPDICFHIICMSICVAASHHTRWQDFCSVQWGFTDHFQCVGMPLHSLPLHWNSERCVCATSHLWWEGCHVQRARCRNVSCFSLQPVLIHLSGTLHTDGTGSRPMFHITLLITRTRTKAMKLSLSGRKTRHLQDCCIQWMLVNESSRECIGPRLLFRNTVHQAMEKDLSMRPITLTAWR